jgi:hypothetical protein
MDINYVIVKAIIVITGILFGFFGRILYNKIKSKKTRGGGAHRWSGWPGAFCLYCGAQDLLETAIGRGYFDPYTGKWDSKEHQEKYSNRPCPFVPAGVDPYSLPLPLPNNWEYTV